MVVLDERANLRTDCSTIKAHHKELAHLPATWVSKVTTQVSISQSGKSLNRPRRARVPQRPDKRKERFRKG